VRAWHRRATVRAFGCPRRPVALLARGEEGLAARPARCGQRVGPPCRSPSTSPTTPEGGAATRIEDELGPSMCGSTTRRIDLSRRSTSRAGRVQAGHRRDVPRSRVRNAGGMQRMRRNRGRVARSCRSDQRCLPRHPVQSVYCGAKHAIQGFTRVQCAVNSCTSAGNIRITWCRCRGEHAPVRLGAVAPTSPSPAVPPIYQPEIAAG